MTAFKCLCCDLPVLKQGAPVTEERAARGYAFLRRIGFTREALLGEHRANLDYTAPGLVEWIERNAP